MSEDQLPVELMEIVLRRIHKDYFDGTLRIPVRPAAFKPTESDQDGLSVYRERFVSPSEVAASGRTPGGAAGGARSSAAELVGGSNAGTSYWPCRDTGV